MSRAILVDGPSGPIRVISVEDVVACEARLLLDLAASVPVPAKHANDYLQTCGFSEIVQPGNCVAGSSEANPPDDIRRDEHTTQRVDCNSSKSPDQS